VPSAARVQDGRAGVVGRGAGCRTGIRAGRAVPGRFGRNDARKRLLPFRRVCG